MKIDIPYSKTTSKQQAYSVIKENVSQQLLENFKIKAELGFDDANTVIKAKGKGFALNLEFFDDKAVMNLSLGLLLKAVESKVSQKVRHQLEKFL